MTKHVLLVEDDLAVAGLNAKALMQEGYTVSLAGTLAEGKEAVRKLRPDLVILDMMLPDGSGLDFCRELRRNDSVPVLFLTVCSEKESIINGLRAGGDDYLIKPYDMGELKARVAAQLRRAALLNDSAEGRYKVGGLLLEANSHKAFFNGRDLQLKPKEFSILMFLTRQKGLPLDGKKLYEKVWGMQANEDLRTIWVHISSLRKKLSQIDCGIQIIHVPEAGYHLVYRKANQDQIREEEGCR